MAFFHSVKNVGVKTASMGTASKEKIGLLFTTHERKEYESFAHGKILYDNGPTKLLTLKKVELGYVFKKSTPILSTNNTN